jgi:hypothetical protein
MSIFIQKKVVAALITIVRGGEENFLAVDAIRHNRIKTNRRCKPAVPCLGVSVFYIWPSGRLDEDAAVKIH